MMYSCVFCLIPPSAQNVTNDVSVEQQLQQQHDGVGDVTQLQQCVSLFMEPEVLSADEAWYCPQCKTHRQATKQLSVWRLPKYLIIQLKRFSYRNFLWCDKVDKEVNFPTRCVRSWCDVVASRYGHAMNTHTSQLKFHGFKSCSVCVCVGHNMIELSCTSQC